MTKLFNERVFSPERAIKKAKELSRKGKRIVLVGGCFDIIHKGHILFLKKAKDEGDFLFVFLESDKKVRELKGYGRPINPQEDRAAVLSGLRFVDGIIMLPKMTSNIQYDRLITQIKPAIIAVTEGDPNLKQREEQAGIAGGKIKSVTKRISYSTTKTLAQLPQKTSK